ncbi:MAG: RDD family protein [Gammaproteobacteria bacterium]
MAETTNTANADIGAANAGHPAPVDGGGLSEGAGGDLENRQYVGFWARLGAALIDTIVVHLPVGLVMILLIYGTDIDAIPANVSVRDLPIFIAHGIVEIAFWRWKGATPGKMVIGAKIVDEKTGELPSVFQCIRRYAIFFIGVAAPAFTSNLLPIYSAVLASCVMVAISKKKQGLHDGLAGTVVIKVPKKQQ